MKKIIGFFIILLSLAFITILFLRIWDITIVSLEFILKSSVTLILLGITIVLLIIVYGAFFRNNNRGYDHGKGNRAHPKSPSE